MQLLFWKAIDGRAIWTNEVHEDSNFSILCLCTASYGSDSCFYNIQSISNFTFFETPRFKDLFPAVIIAKYLRDLA